MRQGAIKGSKAKYALLPFHSGIIPTDTRPFAGYPEKGLVCYTLQAAGLKVSYWVIMLCGISTGANAVQVEPALLLPSS